MPDNEKDNFKKDSLIDLRRNTELFHNDQNLYITYRRIQNIVAAVFLVIGSLEDKEEIKRTTQQVALKALAKVIHLIEYKSIDEVHVREIIGPILELSSLLSIGFWSGSISEMNMIVLQREISKIEKGLYELITVHKNKYLISSALFKDVEDMELQGREITKGQYKRHIIRDSIKDTAKSTLKDNSSIKDNIDHSTVSLSDTRSERRQVILKLLGEKGNLSIKDFTTVISNYSEKTIQRELLALVSEGLVKRQGERRWSTYSLA